MYQCVAAFRTFDLILVEAPESKAVECPLICRWSRWPSWLFLSGAPRSTDCPLRQEFTTQRIMTPRKARNSIFLICFLGHQVTSPDLKTGYDRWMDYLGQFRYQFAVCVTLVKLIFCLWVSGSSSSTGCTSSRRETVLTWTSLISRGQIMWSMSPHQMQLQL